MKSVPPIGENSKGDGMWQRRRQNAHLREGTSRWRCLEFRSIRIPRDRLIRKEQSMYCS